MKKILYLLLVVLVVSCKSKVTKETISRIDSLYSVVEELKNQFEDSNIDSAKFFYEYTLNDIEIFKSKVFEMPENDSLIKSFNNYGVINKGFKKIVRQKDILDSDMTLTLQQLENLKHDITSRLITNQDTINLFLDQEASEVQKLQVQTRSILNLHEQNRGFFNQVNPQIDKFKKEIKAQFPDKEFSTLN